MNRDTILNPPELPFSPKISALGAKVHNLFADFEEGTKHIDPQFIGTAEVARFAKQAADEFFTKAVALDASLRDVQAEVAAERQRRLAAITTPSKDAAEASYDAATIIALAATPGMIRDTVAFDTALMNDDVAFVRSALRAPPTLALVPLVDRQRILEDTARAIDENGWARVEQDLAGISALLYKLSTFTQEQIGKTLAGKLSPADRSAFDLRAIGLLVDAQNRMRAES